MYKCFRCGRPLTNGESIRRGIGPICFSKRELEQTFEDRVRNDSLQCHHGYRCFNPEHARTLIWRFWHRFQAMARQTGLEDSHNDLCVKVLELAKRFVGTLRMGLEERRVPVPTTKQVVFNPENAIKLGLHAERGPHGLISYNRPVDWDEQWRRSFLRAKQICPFGLNCCDPDSAVNDIFQLLSIMRYEVEPAILRSCRVDDDLDEEPERPGWGWSWDRQMYDSLAGILEVMGLRDEAKTIREVVGEQHARPAQHAWDF